MPRWAASALCAIVIALAAPGAAQANVLFDRAFGVGVDTGSGVFENCTIASSCQEANFVNGDGRAGSMHLPNGTAVDAKGRLLVADDLYHRVDRFVIAPDGTASFDRAFGVDVDPSDGTTG